MRHSSVSVSPNMPQLRPSQDEDIKRKCCAKHRKSLHAVAATRSRLFQLVSGGLHARRLASDQKVNAPPPAGSQGKHGNFDAWIAGDPATLRILGLVGSIKKTRIHNRWKEEVGKKYFTSSDPYHGIKSKYPAQVQL